MTEGGVNGKSSQMDRMATRIIYMAAGLVAIACLTIVYHKVWTKDPSLIAFTCCVPRPMRHLNEAFMRYQITDIGEDDFDDDILLEMPVLGAAAKQAPIEESATLRPWTHDRVLRHFQLSSMAQIRWSRAGANRGAAQGGPQERKPRRRDPAGPC